MKRTQPRRDWTDARAKVEAEGECRFCMARWHLEAAHVIGRSHDEPKSGGKTLYVKPERVIPLCRGCHYSFDHRLIGDALPHLTLDEQLQAVADAGGIENARVRLCPGLYERKVVA